MSEFKKLLNLYYWDGLLDDIKRVRQVDPLFFITFWNHYGEEVGNPSPLGVSIFLRDLVNKEWKVKDHEIYNIQPTDYNPTDAEVAHKIEFYLEKVSENTIQLLESHLNHSLSNGEMFFTKQEMFECLETIKGMKDVKKQMIATLEIGDELDKRSKEYYE